VTAVFLNAGAGMLLLLMASGAETTAPHTNAPLKAVAPGVFELGKVRLNKTEGSVSFPAVINLSPGLIEYLVVTENGKIHESLLRTEVEPFHIHTAMLLIGAKGAGTNMFPEKPTGALPGDKINLEVSWKIEGKKHNRRGEELVYNGQTKSTMSQGHWIYNGSRIFEGTFIAQQDGSIVSLIEDPDALINNPRPGRESDEIWEVNTNGLPALNSPVEVKLTLIR
jgi:hypothetical protein